MTYNEKKILQTLVCYQLFTAQDHISIEEFINREFSFIDTLKVLKL